MSAAVLKFCEAALAVNPHRVGKPLFGPLAASQARACPDTHYRPNR